ncbi:Arc family DNA-binding protein, partial [Pseudomonas sp. D47]
MPTESETAQITYNSRTADKFALRLPEGLRDRINLAAENNHRSMNS